MNTESLTLRGMFKFVAPFPNVTSAAMKDWFFLSTSRGEPQLAQAAHANPQ